MSTLILFVLNNEVACLSKDLCSLELYKAHIYLNHEKVNHLLDIFQGVMYAQLHEWKSNIPMFSPASQFDV